MEYRHIIVRTTRLGGCFFVRVARCDDLLAQRGRRRDRSRSGTSRDAFASPPGLSLSRTKHGLLLLSSPWCDADNNPVSSEADTHLVVSELIRGEMTNDSLGTRKQIPTG